MQNAQKVGYISCWQKKTFPIPGGSGYPIARESAVFLALGVEMWYHDLWRDDHEGSADVYNRIRHC